MAFRSLLAVSLISLAPVLLSIVLSIGPGPALGASIAPEKAFPLRYEVGKSYLYNYTTEVLVSEPGDDPVPGSSKNVGLHLTATAEITPVWNNALDQLVQLKVLYPKINGVARPQMAREFGILSIHPIYFQWQAGQIQRIYAMERDPVVSVNIKKGIISMLQLQLTAGQRTEVDASGECLATYERQGTTIKKSKTSCKNLELAGQYKNANEMYDVGIDSLVTTIYEIPDNLIKTAKTTAVHSSHVNIRKSLAASINLSQLLQLATVTDSAQRAEGSTLDQAVQSLDKGLYAMMLGTDFDIRQCSQTGSGAAEVVEKFRSDLATSSMAKTEAGTAFLAVLQAFRSTSKKNILEVFKNSQNTQIIPQLIDAAVAAQTSASQEAMMEFLDFGSDDITHPERYLMAVGFSTHPSEKVLTDLHKLLQKNIADERLRESVAMATGAVLHTYCLEEEACKSEIVAKIRKTFLERLEGCEDEMCKCSQLRALGNAGLPDTIPVLLQYTEKAKEGTVNNAAIAALGRIQPKFITQEVLDAMSRVYHENHRTYVVPARVLALDILLKHNPSKNQIQNIILSTANETQPEAETYIHAKLNNLARENEKLRTMVQEFYKSPSLNNYNVLSKKGKSLSFKGTLADTASASTSYDMYVLNGNSGVMKRSGMVVDIFNEKQTAPLMAFKIFAEGLESLTGDAGEADPSVEPVAGMSLDMMGVSLRPVEFFRGSGGLMSAVWSAPSELTTALQGNLLLHDHASRLHLQNGMISELKVQGCVSMDLSGLISISLWNRNAHSLIKNSGALVIQGSLGIDTRSFRTSLDFSAEGASAIDFVTDVDFYEEPFKSCLQMSQPAFTFKHNVVKHEHGGFKTSYRRTVKRASEIGARSFPLPAINAKMCRILLANQE